MKGMGISEIVLLAAVAAGLLFFVSVVITLIVSFVRNCWARTEPRPRGTVGGRSDVGKAIREEGR